MPQNSAILGSTLTMQDRDRVTEEEHITQLPRRSKDSVYVDTKLAKLLVQLLVQYRLRHQGTPAECNVLTPSIAISESALPKLINVFGTCMFPTVFH